MTFAEQHRTARKAQKLTQQAVAAIYGVSSRTVWAWEAGKFVPSEAEQLGALAMLLGSASATDGTNGTEFTVNFARNEADLYQGSGLKGKGRKRQGMANEWGQS